MFPRSVFEGPNQQIFLTSGLQHFMNWGVIYKITLDKPVKKSFKSSGFPNIDQKTGKVISEGGLFIGPGAYKAADKLYLFCHNPRHPKNKGARQHACIS